MYRHYYRTHVKFAQRDCSPSLFHDVSIITIYTCCVQNVIYKHFYLGNVLKSTDFYLQKFNSKYKYALHVFKIIAMPQQLHKQSILDFCFHKSLRRESEFFRQKSVYLFCFKNHELVCLVFSIFFLMYFFYFGIISESL
jgi:hypothetical protein